MFKLFLVLLFGITLAYADYPIHPNQIPEKSKQFLSQHFKQDVTFAKKRQLGIRGISSRWNKG